MSVSVIIPTYNEKGNISKLIDTICIVLSKEEYEIIVVDDNSEDKTAELLRTKYKNSQFIRIFSRNNFERSLATAIIYGIEKSNNSTIIGIDGDGNHPPALIPKLLNELMHADLIVASRFISGGAMPNIFRSYPTFLFNVVLKYIFKYPTMDNMSGYYAVKKNMLLKLPIKTIYRGYGEYHLRLLYFAKQNSFKIKEIPVVYGERKYGKSKSNLLKMFFTYTFTLISLQLKL